MQNLRELMEYTNWADAEFWRVWEALPAAHSHRELRVLADHLTLVQFAFLKLLKGETLDGLDPNAPPLEFEALRRRAIDNHDNWKRFLAELKEEDPGKELQVPWFSRYPVKPTFAEVITQVVLHTQHHRAQCLALLRTLGGEKVIVDWILWVVNRKPTASWSPVKG